MAEIFQGSCLYKQGGISSKGRSWESATDTQSNDTLLSKIFIAVPLDQGFANLRTRTLLDGSCCESQNIKIYARQCKTSPTAVTRLNGRAKYLRGVTSLFPIQGHLIHAATKGNGFFCNWKFSYKYLYCCKFSQNVADEFFPLFVYLQLYVYSHDS
jgi:hypothetical protein